MSLWTIAIAIKAQIACKYKQHHLMSYHRGFTVGLTENRCTAGSNAFLAREYNKT